MNERVLFLVPARGGSRRVPGKNLREVGGIPLVGRAVRAGLRAAESIGGGHRVVCTTDDDTIAAVAQAWGAEILRRPAELATHTATSVDVAVHALDALRAEGWIPTTLALLQPTSPLLDPADVVAAVERHHRSGVPVTTAVASHPAQWHQGVGGDGRLHPATPVPGTDALLTGACYVIAPDELRDARRFVIAGRTLGHLVDPASAVDVDEEHDLAAAEALLATRPVRPVPLGQRTVGDGRVVVIAEAGVNHNGDVALARRLIDAAAAAGADIVKFQTFDPASLVASGAPTAAYQRRAGETGDQMDLLRRLVLPESAWPDLQAHARSRGLVFLSTPFDDASAALLDRLDVPAFKVGSGELTNTPFLTRLARLGRPLLVSTGMADMTEVAAAVDAVRAGGDVPLALFHCVSSYPAPPADANLRAIETMRRAFAVPTGWSDHTEGIELPIAAVAAGAMLVEKHLTLDRTMPGPDHRASLEPDQFAAMTAAIRVVEAAMGSGRKRPVEAERDVAAVARRSLHWAGALAAGVEIGEADLVALRPGTGIPPGRLASLVGRRTAREVRPGSAVTPEDLEGGA